MTRSEHDKAMEKLAPRLNEVASPLARSLGFACEQCGASMNPAERMLGAVCGKCCRANHRAVAGR